MSDIEIQKALDQEENQIKELLKQASYETLLNLKKEGAKLNPISKKIKKTIVSPKIEKDKTIEKHKNKNRPTERSSKVPVSRFKVVIESKKKIGRDPRFDTLSGHLNKDLFTKSYKFLFNQQEEEINLLEKELTKKKKYNQDEKEKLREALSNNKNDLSRWKQMEVVDTVKQEYKKEMKEREEKGKSKYYLKKGDIKKKIYEKKFNDLDQSKKLERKMLEKKKKESDRLYRDFKQVYKNSLKRRQQEKQMDD